MFQETKKIEGRHVDHSRLGLNEKTTTTLAASSSLRFSENRVKMSIDNEDNVNRLKKRKPDVDAEGEREVKQQKLEKDTPLPTTPKTASSSRLNIDVTRRSPIPEDPMTPNTRKKHRALFIAHSDKIDEFADDTREDLEPRVGDDYQADIENNYKISMSSYGELLENHNLERVLEFDTAYFHPGRLVEAWCEKRHSRFDAIVTRTPPPPSSSSSQEEETGYDVAFRDGTRAINLTLDQIGGSRMLWTIPNIIRRKSTRTNRNGRDFAASLLSSARLRVAAEVAMLLRRSRKNVGEYVGSYFDKCVNMALSPWALHDEMDLRTLFSIVFSATWTEVEIHRFKVLLNHHGEGRWDKISRDMIAPYTQDDGTAGHVKTPDQCAAFFFLNSYVFFCFFSMISSNLMNF